MNHHLHVYNIKIQKLCNKAFGTYNKENSYLTDSRRKSLLFRMPNLMKNTKTRLYDTTSVNRTKNHTVRK